MQKIELQLECMRKLHIPEKYIQNILSHSTDIKNLMIKLIKCEEQYSDIGKMDNDEINFNNYKGSLNKFCDYLDKDKLVCRLKKLDCINCDSYFELGGTNYEYKTS